MSGESTAENNDKKMRQHENSGASPREGARGRQTATDSLYDNIRRHWLRTSTTNRWVGTTHLSPAG